MLECRLDSKRQNGTAFITCKGVMLGGQGSATGCSAVGWKEAIYVRALQELLRNEDGFQMGVRWHSDLIIDGLNNLNIIFINKGNIFEDTFSVNCRLNTVQRDLGPSRNSFCYMIKNISYIIN